MAVVVVFGALAISLPRGGPLRGGPLGLVFALKAVLLLFGGASLEERSSESLCSMLTEVLLPMVMMVYATVKFSDAQWDEWPSTEEHVICGRDSGPANQSNASKQALRRPIYGSMDVLI